MVILETLAEATWIALGNFEWVIIGVLVGMGLGMLPGMGGSVTLALLIPFSLGMEPTHAFLLFGSALGATSFSGSVTAILVNTPGTASNAATLLDGYPMTRQGRAKEAIGASASASAMGAVIGLAVFLLSIPFLREFARLFGTREMFWLALFGIAIIPAVIRGSFLLGVIGGGLGLLFGFHGLNIMSGQFRFPYLLQVTGTDGIGLIPMIIGLFAIGELMNLAIKGEEIQQEGEKPDYSGQLWKGVMAPFHAKSIFIRSAIIGIVIGAIPGMGGSVANLVAYAQAAQLSPNKEQYGKGCVEGVIASESANDSKDGGQLIPTFGLGIPGSGSMAVMLGAVIIHGMTPGPQFIFDQLLIIMVVFVGLLFSNVLTSIIGISIANHLMLITKLKTAYLLPAIFGLAFIAAFITNQSFGDVVLTFVFGLIGLVFVYLNISRIPIIIGLVLADILESNFVRGLRIAGEDLTYFIGSPLAFILALAVFLTFAWPLIRPYVKPRITDTIDSVGLE